MTKKAEKTLAKIKHDETRDRWIKTLKDHDMTTLDLARLLVVDPNRVTGWLAGTIIPRSSTIQNIGFAMKRILTSEKIPYHPAYGYATPEQVEKLQRIGLGPDRDQLLKKIEQQTADRGRVYK